MKTLKEDSEPAKHLRENREHKFKWKVLCAPKGLAKEEISRHQLFLLTIPFLNNQLDLA